MFVCCRRRTVGCCIIVQNGMWWLVQHGGIVVNIGSVCGGTPIPFFSFFLWQIVYSDIHTGGTISVRSSSSLRDNVDHNNGLMLLLLQQLLLLSLHDFSRFVDLVVHDILPLGANELVQLQGRDSVLDGTMSGPVRLNLPLQLFLRQLFEFARPQNMIGFVQFFHEWFILGRITNRVPRMRQLEYGEIVLECVADQDLVRQQGRYLLTTRCKVQTVLQ
jgi:hypothetical protein